MLRCSVSSGLPDASITCQSIAPIAAASCFRATSWVASEASLFRCAIRASRVERPAVGKIPTKRVSLSIRQVTQRGTLLLFHEGSIDDNRNALGENAPCGLVQRTVDACRSIRLVGLLRQRRGLADAEQALAHDDPNGQ